MIAHIRKCDLGVQSVKEHIDNVAELANRNAERASLSNLAELVALLHDAGKMTNAFEEYIYGKSNTKAYHSPIGAIFAYEQWYRKTGDNSLSNLTAQMVSMVIRAHHGGLLDCVSPKTAESPFLQCINQDKEPLHYSEAIKNYFDECYNIDTLNAKYEQAEHELSTKLKDCDNSYIRGMLTRFILSCLVDADRWDSACFGANANSLEPEREADWSMLSNQLEKYLSGFGTDDAISQIRHDISSKCKAAANSPSGVYSLSVPTGGGKTLSSLRFAINHALKWQKQRIFYVIPFNTILEQNADEIKKALQNYGGILEHYGTIVCDDDEAGDSVISSELLTERWNSPIILTSMVQFLNSAYKKSNTHTRRFCRLANSVIVFDEIQALPHKCKKLFELLIGFLSQQLNCTVLLCTATQPYLEVETVPLLQQEYSRQLESSLKRVEIHDLTDRTVSYAGAADELLIRLKEYGSVMIVVNTKVAARELFLAVKEKLDNSYFCAHLSTSMCPKHRHNTIEAIKTALKKGNPIFCVSTMLIEAGVNISFPCVIRALAALPSILQAAGRCNRHMEMSPKMGNVEIWNLSQESLGRLPEIEKGKNCSMSVIKKHQGNIQSEQALNDYFIREDLIYKADNTYKYPYDNVFNLTDMISKNTAVTRQCTLLCQEPKLLCTYQSFASVGESFNVIDEDTISVIVPFEEGEQCIAELASGCDMKTAINILRKAQQYSVSIYRSNIKRMAEKSMVYRIGETGAYALRKEYYDNSLGIIEKSHELEFINY